MPPAVLAGVSSTGDATQAVNDGAKIILGPVFAQEANAAGNAVAASGVSILSFSNNPAIAGGNVFVLGTTFPNISNRLSRYAVRQGKGKVMILHDRTPAGDAGRAAIEASVAAASGSLDGPDQVIGVGVFQQIAVHVVHDAGGKAFFVLRGDKHHLLDPGKAVAEPEFRRRHAEARVLGGDAEVAGDGDAPVEKGPLNPLHHPGARKGPGQDRDGGVAHGET